MIVFNHLRTFIAVARFGSFTRAAWQLCITQPAVSGHIAALEEALGAKLFNRTGREIVLTDSGRVVLKAAHDIMERLDLMQRELDDITTLKGGTIRIGASRIIGVYLLPKIVTAFREKFPEIEIQLSIHSARSIAESVLENAFDIAVVAEGDQFFSTNVGVKSIGTDPARRHCFTRLRTTPFRTQRAFGRRGEPGTVHPSGKHYGFRSESSTRA